MHAGVLTSGGGDGLARIDGARTAKTFGGQLHALGRVPAAFRWQDGDDTARPSFSLTSQRSRRGWLAAASRDSAHHDGTADGLRVELLGMLLIKRDEGKTQNETRRRYILAT